MSLSSIDDLTEALKELALGDPTNNLGFTVITGINGKKIFDRAMKRYVLYNSLKCIYDQKLITKDENITLNNMINSDDFENFYLAQEIINNKLGICQ